MKKHTLHLKNDLSELERLHPFLEEIGRKIGISKKCMLETNLTLEEVFSNIVSYGYDDPAEHFVKISITIGKGNFKICVEDDGKPFNPLKAGQPDLPKDVNHGEPGGLGLHLIKHFMDDIQYERRQNKNILTMTKKSLASESG